MMQITQGQRSYSIPLISLVTYALILSLSALSSVPTAVGKTSYVREERVLERAARRLRGATPGLKKTFTQIQRATARLRSGQRTTSKRRSLKRSLVRAEKHLQTINAQLTLYYQAPRPELADSSPATLRLRSLVWRLLHAREGLYQIVEGRFCLKSSWRAVLASGYRALGMLPQAELQARHARACQPTSLTPRGEP